MFCIQVKSDPFLVSSEQFRKQRCHDTATYQGNFDSFLGNNNHCIHTESEWSREYLRSRFDACCCTERQTQDQATHLFAHTILPVFTPNAQPHQVPSPISVFTLKPTFPRSAADQRNVTHDGAKLAPKPLFVIEMFQWISPFIVVCCYFDVARDEKGQQVQNWRLVVWCKIGSTVIRCLTRSAQLAASITLAIIKTIKNYDLRFEARCLPHKRRLNGPSTVHLRQNNNSGPAYCKWCLRFQKASCFPVPVPTQPFGTRNLMSQRASCS